MRNMSYMGRVVVKLIIIAIIAFVVITTAVFIIKKYNNEVKQGGSSQLSEGQSEVTTLPGAVGEVDSNNKSSTHTETAKTDSNKDKGTKSSDKEKTSSSEAAATSSEPNQEPTSVSSQELPKTGPADIWQAAGVLALIAFSSTYYFNSLRR